MSEAADSLAEIRAYNKKRGPGCATGGALAEMDDKLAATVRAALADRSIEFKAISRWLAKTHDVTIAPGSLSRHLAGDCRCGK